MKFHWPLYSDIIFLLTITVRGYQISIAYCLFSIGIFSLRNMPMHYAMVFKGCKNYNF